MKRCQRTVLIKLLSSSSESQPASTASECPSRTEGLWRTVLAGRGHTLKRLFANLEQSSHVERLVRHPQRDLLGARVTLTPEEGEGYWELTRIPR